MPKSPQMAHLVAAHANAKMRGDTIASANLKREITALKLEEYAARLLADAPPLSDEQRARLAAILRTPAGGGVR